MKHLLVWLIVLCGCALSYGQTTAPSIKGRVTDAKTGSAIEFANAIIVDSVNHTIASTTVSGGEFSISDPINGDYYLIIQLMGYQPYTSERIAFRNGTPIDIGTVPLEPIESLLQEVTGKRSAVRPPCLLRAERLSIFSVPFLRSASMPTASFHFGAVPDSSSM